MSELDPALFAALQAPRLILFGAVEIVMPARTVRLLDGSAETVIAGESYIGRDPEWGVLDTIKGLNDSNGDNAPAPTIGMIPADDLALAAMLDPALQGSPVTIMVGVLSPATGLPIGECYAPFTGELDVATVKWGLNDRRVDFRCAGIGDRLFATEEGRRLSDAFHQEVWPGELGLAFVTDVESKIDWGQASKSSAEAIRTNLPGPGLGLGGGSFGGGSLFSGRSFV